MLCDLQYVYVVPGGNHKIAKDHLMPPRKHLRHFKVMLHVAELLPTGKKLPLSKRLALQWYYMTYHHADCIKYIKSSTKIPPRCLRV